MTEKQGDYTVGSMQPLTIAPETRLPTSLLVAVLAVLRPVPSLFGISIPWTVFTALKTRFWHSGPCVDKSKES